MIKPKKKLSKNMKLNEMWMSPEIIHDDNKLILLLKIQIYICT